MSEVIVDMEPGPVTYVPGEPDLSELYGALAKAQGMFRAPRRTKPVTVRMKSGGSYSFSYAPLDEILDAIKEGMSANGLSHRQYLARHEHQVVLRTVIRHSSGQHEESDYPIFPTDEGGQGFASGVTYARRQGLSLALGLAPEDDDDGNVAAGNTVVERPVERAKANGHKSPPPPLPAPPAPPAPPHDPSTGEVMPPHRITLPFLGGQPNYVQWGGQFIAALKSAGNYAEWLAWQTENSGFIAECAERAPKAAASIKAAIKKTSEQYGEVDETLSEADVEQVLNT